MIPSIIDTQDDLRKEFEPVTDQPTYTFRMDLTANRITGYTDGQEAMKQVIFKILQTERFQYPKVYSNNYGVELWGLVGMPISYVLPEIERRITEALTWDERITSVDNFEFDVQKKVVNVKFTANTVFGEVTIETGVNF